MKTYKDFFWFWKDWYEIDWKMYDDIQDIEVYDTFNKEDKFYMKEMYTKELQQLWRSLTSRKNVMHSFEFEWEMYSVRDICELIWKWQRFVYKYLIQKKYTVQELINYLHK